MAENVALVSGAREAYGRTLALNVVPPHADEGPVRGEVRVHLEAPLKAIAEARPATDCGEAPADVRAPRGLEGGGAAPPAVGSTLEAYGYVVEAEYDPAR